MIDKLRRANKDWQGIGKKAFTFLVLFLFLVYLYSNRSDLKVLTSISWSSVVFLILIMMLNILANAAQSAYFFRAVGAPMSIWESFGLSNIGSAVGLFIPQGTMITKAVYLKQVYRIPISKTPAIFFGSLVVFLFIGGLVMSCSNLLFTMSGGVVPGLIWLVAVGALFSVAIFFFGIPPWVISHSGRLGGYMLTLREGWDALRGNRRCLIMTSVLQCVIFILQGIMITMAYNTIGLDINPFIGVSMTVFVSFSNIMAVTPSNLGVQEAIYGLLTLMAGMEFIQGVITSTLLRACGLLVTAILAPIAWYFLFFRQGIRLFQEVQRIDSVEKPS